MAYDPHSNLAISSVQSGSTVIASATGTTLNVGSGQGVLFAVNQNLTISPNNALATATNSEIVRITAITADTLTVSRAQEGTTALPSLAAGYFVFNGLTAKSLTDIEADINTLKLTGSSVTIRTVTANTTATNTDNVLIVTQAGITVTLQSAATATVKRYVIKNNSGGRIYVTPQSPQRMDGVALLNVEYDESLEYVPNGSNWSII